MTVQENGREDNRGQVSRRVGDDREKVRKK